MDVYEDTFNMSAESLEDAILKVEAEGKLTPKVIIVVDLFGHSRLITIRSGLLLTGMD